jgi:hypothetical protein
MKENLLYVLQLVGYLFGGIGLLGAGIGAFMYAIGTGSRNERKDVMGTADTIVDHYKKENAELKQIVIDKDEKYGQKIDALTSDFNGKMQALSEKVGILTGQLNAERLQNEEFKKIFQGMNPETDKFMKFMVESVNQHTKAHEKIMEVLSGLTTVLADIHTTSTSNHDLLKQPTKFEGISVPTETTLEAERAESIKA